MRKRIVLLLSGILLAFSAFSGCTDEDMQLAEDLLEAVLAVQETDSETEVQNGLDEDETDAGAIVDFGGGRNDITENSRETVTEEESFTASIAETESSAAYVPESTQEAAGGVQVTEDGYYYYAEDVALYIATYNHLPPNYITKRQAEDLGWSSNRGNLWTVAPGMCIGGDRFGNYEGKLPVEKGRKYTECDVNYEGGYRQADRIVFSNDGLIYYTEDHYETFTLLYGEELL